MSFPYINAKHNPTEIIYIFDIEKQMINYTKKSFIQMDMVYSMTTFVLD